jgi:hypothetical protein
VPDDRGNGVRSRHGDPVEDIIVKTIEFVAELLVNLAKKHQNRGRRSVVRRRGWDRHSCYSATIDGDCASRVRGWYRGAPVHCLVGVPPSGTYMGAPRGGARGASETAGLAALPVRRSRGLRESESVGHARTDDRHVVFGVQPFNALVVALGGELVDLTYVPIESDTWCQ